MSWRYQRLKKLINMAKFTLLTLTNFSLSKIKKDNLIRLTNIVIFIALFAVSAAIISLYFERKIENLNKNLSAELGNEIIYSYWLSETPKNIRNIESLLSQISRENSYLIFMQGVDERLVTNRDLAHNPVIDLIRFNRRGLDFLEYSLNDAILLSQSKNDVENIKTFKNKFKTIYNTFFSILEENELRDISWKHRFERLSEKERKSLFKRALLAKPDLINSLNEIKNFYINFNLEYFYDKQSNSQTKVLKIKDKIKSASLKESRSILFAFIIQLIIFFILQFFEFGFNISEKLRRRK